VVARPKLMVDGSLMVVVVWDRYRPRWKLGSMRSYRAFLLYCGVSSALGCGHQIMWVDAVRYVSSFWVTVKMEMGDSEW
jgi:hypothetical protein